MDLEGKYKEMDKLSFKLLSDKHSKKDVLLLQMLVLLAIFEWNMIVNLKCLKSMFSKQLNLKVNNHRLNK